MRRSSITPSFVDVIPDRLDDGILYVCERYKVAVHRCCCGCGDEVVTPLGPADWSIKKAGRTVSVTPSIGNWKFSCKSHYWIRGNRVVWTGTFSEGQIERVKRQDEADKEAYIAAVNMGKEREAGRVSWIVKLWSALVSWWKA